MQADAISGLVDRYLDQDLLVHSMQRFVRVPTEVPSGYETLMEPDDPKLVHYVQEVIRPELADLGVDLLDAPLNNLIAASGSGETGKSLLIMNYTPTQHNNLMDDPFSGRVGSAAAYGRRSPITATVSPWEAGAGAPWHAS